MSKRIFKELKHFQGAQEFLRKLGIFKEPKNFQGT